MKYLVCNVIDNKTERVKFRCALNVAVAMLDTYCPVKTLEEQANHLMKRTREKMRSRRVTSHDTTLDLKLHTYKYITKSNIKCYYVEPLGFIHRNGVNTPVLKDYDGQ